MKQITEEYCSFEIAKLLKEKGFDEIECVGYYCDDKPKEVQISYCGETNSTWEKRCCQAPTHQMALKWLREVHNQIIIIKYGNVGFVEESILQWWLELLNTKGELHACNIVDGNKSYEEACEDSILYVLKNLI